MLFIFHSHSESDTRRMIEEQIQGLYETMPETIQMSETNLTEMIKHLQELRAKLYIGGQMKAPEEPEVRCCCSYALSSCVLYILCAFGRRAQRQRS